MQNYDENLPISRQANTITALKWIDEIQPYVKSEQIFNCPSDSVNKFVPPASRSASNDYGSYGANDTYYDDGNPLTIDDTATGIFTAPSLSITAIPATAETIYAADVSGFGDDPTFYWQQKSGTGAQQAINTTTQPNYLPNNGSPLATIGIVARHLDTTNVLFVDGHVKSFKLTNLIQPATGTLNNGCYRLFTIEDD